MNSVSITAEARAVRVDETTVETVYAFLSAYQVTQVNNEVKR